MELLEIILMSALNKIDEIYDYMNFVGKYLLNDVKNTNKRSEAGFLVGIYLDSLIEDNNINKEENIQKVLKKAQELAGKYIDVIEVDKQNKSILYKNKKNRKELNIKKDTENIHNAVSRVSMFYNSLLINFIIEYENYISNIFSYYVNQYPDAYLNEEKIKYVTITDLDNINEIKSVIKKKCVNQIMRENILEWSKKLEDKHNIKLDISKDVLDTFLEAYYRRNLVVHNNLVVNNEYLESIPASLEKPKLNEKLRVNGKYIKNLIKTEKKIIINLTYNIDKKESKNKNLLDVLTNYAYNCMVNKDWETSVYIYDLIKNDKRQDAQEQLYAQMNYWQSVKRLGRFDDVRSEIEKLDVSASEKIYKLAKSVLLEENENALNILELIYKKEDGISASDLEEWPLFLEFRETEEYKKFKEKYKEDFLEKEKNTSVSTEINSIIEELKENRND